MLRTQLQRKEVLCCAALWCAISLRALATHGAAL